MKRYEDMTPEEKATFEKYISLTLVQGDPSEDRTPEEQAELDEDAAMSEQEGRWAEEAAIEEAKQRRQGRPALPEGQAKEREQVMLEPLYIRAVDALAATHKPPLTRSAMYRLLIIQAIDEYHG